MECKECGTRLKNNALFCGVCGAKLEAEPEPEPESEAKIEPLANTCGKCGGIVSENAKFCRHCGEVMEEIAATSEAMTDLVDPGGIAETPSTKGGLGKKSKKLIMSAAIIVVLLIAVRQVGISPKASASSTMDLILLASYDDDLYAKSPGKEEYMLKTTDLDGILVSKDGKKIYSLDEDKDLYLQEGKKAPERIARDVMWATISLSGSTVAYIQDDGVGYNTGALYVKSGNSEPEKVLSEGCPAGKVIISENGKYVAFTEIDEEFSDGDNIRNYLYPVGKEKIKGGKHTAIGVNNKGTILSINEDSDLYIMKRAKDPERVTSEVRSVVANKDFSRLLVLDKSGNLYACNGKNKERLEGNVDEFIAFKGLSQFTGDTISHLDRKEIDIIYAKNDSAYIKFDGKESEKVGGSYLYDIRISDDFRDVTYVNNNSLYIKRFKKGKLKVDEKIDSRVSKMKMDSTGSHIAYEKEGDLYYLAKGKKEGIKIDAKDEVTDFVVKKDGQIYYETRDDELYLTKGKKTGKKIADDVSRWFVTDKAAYVLDFDDTAFEIIGKRKPVKINNDISTILNPSFNMYRQSY